jgi:hypothetical protein
MAERITTPELLTRIEGLEPRVDRLEKIVIVGNGEDSLQTTVSKIEDFVKEMKDSQKFYTRLAASAVITNIIALLFAVGMYFIRVQPLLDKLSAIYGPH